MSAKVSKRLRIEDVQEDSHVCSLFKKAKIADEEVKVITPKVEELSEMCCDSCCSKTLLLEEKLADVKHTVALLLGQLHILNRQLHLQKMKCANKVAKDDYFI